jgi:hypothetical protein
LCNKGQWHYVAMYTTARIHASVDLASSLLV